MKDDIHPEYRQVVFRDASADFLLLTRSTIGEERTGGRTVELDGVEYPVYDVDVSSRSHPFWTGRGRVLDTEGRVEKFERRYGRPASSASSASSASTTPNSGEEGR